MEHGREYTMRAQDIELAKLVARVEELDSDVQKLRADFDGHLVTEDTRYRELLRTLTVLQTTIDQLLVEIKEPLESYKTAKYGFSFLKIVTETVKWLGPLLVGLWIGYGPIRNKIDPVEQIQQKYEQTIKKSVTNSAP